MSNNEMIFIDKPLVHQLIAAQFPQWTNLTIEPVEFSGWDNRTYHLGKEMTIRLPSSAEYSAQVEKEQFWLPKLAPQLPLPISTPVAKGEPCREYPLPWSIYKWIEGSTASVQRIQDINKFATALAEFLKALQRCDATGGPLAGEHNFYRGGNIAIYGAETLKAIKALGDKIDTKRVTEIWDRALASTWNRVPVWIHGDISVGNLLVEHGRLSAVIDFGQLGVGDPACDLAIAWTFFTAESREAFRVAVNLDDDTWARGRGWALWKALIVYAGLPGTNPLELESSGRLIDEIVWG
jgi:aminoglycoside phosphotransferase (APT) family kinase protein